MSLDRVDEGVAEIMTEQAIEKSVDANMWTPDYLPLRPRPRWTW